jgi:cytochrome c biogenesis protein CcmG, thiol:disulfide interchange protein DsbE
MKRTIVLFACLLALAFTVTVAADKKLWAKSYLGKKAPDLVVEKWLGDKPEVKGKIVIIDYWATWCGPCRKAIPELNAFAKKFKEKVVVIGISDETEEKVKAMKDPKIDYFSAIDTKGVMKKQLEVQGIPHVIIMDSDWVVRWEGFPLLNGYELTEAVVEDIVKKYGK